MKKAITIEYDVASLIKEMHADSKEVMSWRANVEVRMEKMEEVHMDMKEFAKDVRDTLLTHSKTIERVSEMGVEIGNIRQDVSLLKTQRAYLFGGTAVVIGIIGILMYTAKAFVAEESKKQIVSQESISFIEKSVEKLLEKYDIRIDEIPDSK